MKYLLAICFTLISLNGSAQVPVSGLIGYYPFSGNANDHSSNGFHGLVSGATLTSDRFGNADCAYQFNGTSFIELSNNFDVLPRTVSFWFNASVIDQTDRLIYCSDNPSIVNGLTNFGVTDNGTNFCWSTVSNVTRFDSITSNAWHHAVIVVDSHSTQKYLDGQLVFTDTLITFQTSAVGLNATVIGANRFESGDFFNGTIDDIRIYNRALDSSEAQALYDENICFVTITVTDTLIINTNITGFNPVTWQHTIKMYPNPANDHLYIDNGSNFASMAGYTLKIENSLSQVVFQNAINTQLFYVDLSTWSGNGLYFVYVIDSGGNTVDVRKIILQ